MLFKNATLFRFPAILAASAILAEPTGDALQETLLECLLKPVGPLELSSRGFVPPLGRDSTDMALWADAGNYVLLAMGTEERMLPGPVLERALAEKLDAIERAEGRKPGGKTRKRIKDELITDLLPKAFVKPSRTYGYLDLHRGVLVVDTSSRKVGEAFVSEVRRALGSFPALPLNAEIAPRSVLTGWVAGEPLPEGLDLGDEATLKDPVDDGGTVKVSRHELQGEEIGRHLEGGKQVTRLGLVGNGDHLSFTLDEDLRLRKVKFLDGAADNLEATDRDDLAAEQTARFFLLTTEFGMLFDTLERALKLSKTDA